MRLYLILGLLALSVALAEPGAWGGSSSMTFLRLDHFNVVYTNSEGRELKLAVADRCVPSDQVSGRMRLHGLCDGSDANTVFVVSEVLADGRPVPGTVVHLGSLRHPLSPGQLAGIKKFGEVDTLLLPLGEAALDPVAAGKVIAQLQPARAVIVLYQTEQARKEFAARQSPVEHILDQQVTIGCTGAPDRRKPPRLLLLGR